MRKLLEILTVFNWISPSVGLAQDFLDPGYSFFMDHKEVTKARALLAGKGYAFRSGNFVSKHFITVPFEDIEEIRRLLSFSGINYKEK